MKLFQKLHFDFNNDLSLSKRNIEIFNLYVNNHNNNHTIDSISKTIGISTTRVKQIYNNVSRKIISKNAYYKISYDDNGNTIIKKLRKRLIENLDYKIINDLNIDKKVELLNHLQRSINSDKNEILNCKVEDILEISVRGYNCLKNEGINCIGDLIKYTQNELAKIPNYGIKSLNELKIELLRLGLSLKK
jgi:DNA-directed RNA polymerase alpha subunit